MDGAYTTLAKWYDLFAGDIDYPGFAGYVTDIIDEYCGGRPELMLELCCGTGNLTRYFAKYCRELIAVDSSAQMLSRAREKEELKDVLFLQQDIRRFELYGTVDAAVCCLDGINYLGSVKELKSFFSLVHNYLNPDGIFVFDMSTIYKLKNILGNRTFTYDFDNVYMVWENTLMSGGKVRLQLEIFEKLKNGLYSRSGETQFQRGYTPGTVKKALAEAGFSVLGCYDAFTKDSPLPESERIFFAARAVKPAADTL